MARILIIGAYGGFGARLSRRLAAKGHQLLVAGRSQEGAERFCGALGGGARPLRMDRALDVTQILARERPELVIDAAGPFQASGYQVPLACVACRIPYLDLADATAFVVGIAELDQPARDAGIAVVSGASTVPALTSAIVRELARGLDAICTVDMALSAANGATGSASVVEAILSYVGKPIRLWRGGRWTEASGWQELRRVDYLLSNGTTLRRRYVALADVPDLALLPDRLPGRPAVTFRAGTELGFHMLGLWLASWPVRWGWLKSIRPFSELLLPLYRSTQATGGQRSAMRVRLVGRSGRNGLERSWTVIAERGEGVEIPVLAAELLAEDLLRGGVAPGARPAADLLSLDQFEPLLAKLAVCHEASERALPHPLYRRLMGSAFDRLPSSVQGIHDFHGNAGASGEAKVTRGRNLLARALGALMRMPGEGIWPVHVHFAEEEGVETWTRDFGGHRFASRLSECGDDLVERFGPLRFFFRLVPDESGLEMQPRRWTVFGIPLPMVLGPRISARESDEAGRFRFDVQVDMPVVGKVVSYSGWLAPSPEPSPSEKVYLSETIGGKPCTSDSAD